MIIDYDKKTVGIKIVFFGPAMSGKTTTIKWLFKEMNLDKELTSIENSVGRTMFMDFGIIPFKMGDGWTINAHVWSATGQDFYKSTREVVMTGADGVVFVADAQQDLIPENKESWDELMLMFESLKTPIPIIVCLNKGDLADVITEEVLRIQLGIPEDITVLNTEAHSGKNVLVAFKRILDMSLRAAMSDQLAT